MFIWKMESLEGNVSSGLKNCFDCFLVFNSVLDNNFVGEKATSGRL